MEALGAIILFVINLIELGIIFIIGWALILLCIFSDNYHFGHQLEGRSAVTAIYMYVIAIAGYVAYAFYCAENGEELPAMFKVFSLLVRKREISKVYEPEFDAERFREDGNVPASSHGRRMWTSVYDDATARMKNRRAEMEEESAAYLEAARKRAEEAEKMHRAQARRNAIRKWERERQRGRHDEER